MKKGKNSWGNKGPYLTVDGIILDDDKILLVKRAIYPYVGHWTLAIGGHVEYGETVEEAIKREAKEELGIAVKIKKLIGVYSDPKRDPRHHSATVAFMLEGNIKKIKLNYESSEYKFFFLSDLPKKIGFDHRKIIGDLKRMAYK